MPRRDKLSISPHLQCGVYQVNTSQRAGGTRSQNRINRTHLNCKTMCDLLKKSTLGNERGFVVWRFQCFFVFPPCSNRWGDALGIASTAGSRFLRFAIGSIHRMLPSRVRIGEAMLRHCSNGAALLSPLRYRKHPLDVSFTLPARTSGPKRGA